MGDRHPLLKFLVFTAACLVAAGWLVGTIGNIALFDDRSEYEAVFTDVRGLWPNDAVKVAGVDVGKVTGIEVDRGRALVRFEVNDNVDLGADTTVEIRWRNTLGLRFLYLHPAGDGRVEPGHRFAVDNTISLVDINTFLNRLTPVMDALDPEASNVVVRELASALVGREQEVRELIDDAGDLFEALASRSDATRRVLDNGATLMNAYAERSDQLRSLLTQFSDVATTVSERNDVLVRAVSELADVQAELRSVLDRNDGNLRGLIDELDQVSAVLADNHDNVEEIVATTGLGIVNYHRISRWGEWFNIRVPGVSVGEENQTTERGAELPPRQDGGSSGASRSGLGAIFELPGGGGGGR